MSKQLVKKLSEYVAVYRDPKTGIAWVENGSTGNGHSCHPNIDASGSVRGMKRLGHWGEGDRCVRSHGFVYNIDVHAASDELDKVAGQYCHCGGKHS